MPTRWPTSRSARSQGTSTPTRKSSSCGSCSSARTSTKRSSGRWSAAPLTGRGVLLVALRLCRPLEKQPEDLRRLRAGHCHALVGDRERHPSDTHLGGGRLVGAHLVGELVRREHSAQAPLVESGLR